MIGGNGPRGQRAAVRYADIYSCYIEERASVDEAGPRITSMEQICAELGRVPASIGRSVGMYVRPLEPAGADPGRLSGSAEEMAEVILTFRDAGYTQVELMYSPGTMEALEALGPVLEGVRAA